ncbi:VPA1267 family protein [Oceanimonas smirnovii]|uniref:VPA1267 family protein n=1 Tax=Oceanimonas smirnovii TaxID=264574 RepID=UPI003AAE7753
MAVRKGTNGAEEGAKNLDKFKVVMLNKPEAFYHQLVWRGKLKRRAMAKLCDFSESVFTQNEKVREALVELEGFLRDKGTLPPLSAAAKARRSNSGSTFLYGTSAKQKVTDANRITQLERQVADLQAKIKVLERYVELGSGAYE